MQEGRQHKQKETERSQITGSGLALLEALNFRVNVAARPYRAWLLSESDARQHRPREGGLTVLTATLDVTFPKGLPQIAGTQKETAVPRKLVLGERCGGGKGGGLDRSSSTSVRRPGSKSLSF